MSAAVQDVLLLYCTSIIELVGRLKRTPGVRLISQHTVALTTPGLLTINDGKDEWICTLVISCDQVIIGAQKNVITALGQVVAAIRQHGAPIDIDVITQLFRV